MADYASEADVRATEWEHDVKGFALQNYNLVEDLAIQGANAWTNKYYQETSTVLAPSGTRATKGLGRFSEFPTARVSWTEQTAVIEKYGLKDEISWEDAMSDNIDVIGRTLLRIAEGVVKAVEDEIFDVMTESQSVSLINSTTTTSVGGDQWDAASDAGDPPHDLLDAMRQIAENNYVQIYKGAGFLWLNPYDYMSILVWVFHKGAQAPKFAEQILADGRVQQTFMGLKVRISNSVVTDYAAVGVSKTCGTWRELQGLNVVTEMKAGVKYTIRAFQYGITQLINPKSFTLIIDTKS